MGQAEAKFDMLSLDADPTSQPSIYWIFALGLFVYLPGYTTSQVTVQRYLCMPGLKQARRALAINAFMATVVYFLFMLAGTVVFVFYVQKGGWPPVWAAKTRSYRTSSHKICGFLAWSD